MSAARAKQSGPKHQVAARVVLVASSLVVLLYTCFLAAGGRSLASISWSQGQRAWQLRIPGDWQPAWAHTSGPLHSPPGVPGGAPAAHPPLPPLEDLGHAADGAPAAAAHPPASPGPSPAGTQMSSVECIEGDNDLQRVCFFSDIYMYNGTLYYLTPSPSTFTLPKVSLRFMMLDHMTEGSDWLSNRTMRAVATLEELPAGAASAPHEEMAEVVLWSSWVVTNYYHVFGEFLPSLHNTICKYMDRCSYGSQAGIQPVDLLPVPGSESREWPRWFHDALGCIAPAPYLHIRAPALAGRLVRVRRALAGVGRDCRARELCADPKYGRRSMGAPAMRLWREQLGACLGHDTSAEAPTAPPVVMVVDRPYQQARHLENGAELMQELQVAYGGFADVSLRYMDGMGLREQAALWSRVSVVVQIHGAAITNWVFLPRNAVVVHIVPRPQPYDEHDTLFAHYLEEDLQPVTNLTYVNLVNPHPSYAHLRVEELYKDHVWRGLPSEAKSAVLERVDCSPLLPDHPRKALRCYRKWLVQNINLVVEPRLLHAAVDRALAELWRKSGVAPPAGFAPVEDVPQELMEASRLAEW